MCFSRYVSRQTDRQTEKQILITKLSTPPGATRKVGYTALIAFEAATSAYCHLANRVEPENVTDGRTDGQTDRSVALFPHLPYRARHNKVGNGSLAHGVGCEPV